MPIPEDQATKLISLACVFNSDKVCAQSSLSASVLQQVLTEESYVIAF
jgi:hypothetical protein